MSGSKDGVSLQDEQIRDALGAWNRKIGRPGERTPSGYWKGLSVKARKGPSKYAEYEARPT